jgi:hypothetical protein
MRGSHSGNYEEWGFLAVMMCSSENALRFGGTNCFYLQDCIVIQTKRQQVINPLQYFKKSMGHFILQCFSVH